MNYLLKKIFGLDFNIRDPVGKDSTVICPAFDYETTN